MWRVMGCCMSYVEFCDAVRADIREREPEQIPPPYSEYDPLLVRNVARRKRSRSFCYRTQVKPSVNKRAAERRHGHDDE